MTERMLLFASEKSRDAYPFAAPLQGMSAQTVAQSAEHRSLKQ